MSRFDEIRAANPDLGFGLYAMTPRGAITLEIYTPDEQTFQFTGPTEEDVLLQAFPEPPEPTPEPAPQPNIFD